MYGNLLGCRVVMTKLVRKNQVKLAEAPQPDRLRYNQKKGGQKEGGQSIIEFALILPMLFLMLVGVVYIAQGFNLQLVVSGAAYEGAKAWAKGQPGSGFKNCFVVRIAA